eukprot:12027046-Ditylum_brightwellii.AAC.1
MICESHCSMPTAGTQRVDQLHNSPQQQHHILIGMHIIQPEKLTKFHQQLTPVLLTQLGYQRNFPIDIVFASKYSGGIGYMHYGAAQLRDKSIGMIQHIRVKAKRGKEFLVLVRWAQLSTETEQPILEDT